MLTTVTELKCKNYLMFLRMIFISTKVIKQAKNTPGNISAMVKGNRLHAYTLTSWINESALKSFRNSGHHKHAMKLTKKFASSFRFVTWETNSQVNWNEALTELDKVKMSYT